jgi:hypothetical protein
MEATMVRKLVLIILASAALALALASVSHLLFPDVLPYAAGEDETASWRREFAAMLVATAWASAEISGLFAIVLGAILWRRRHLSSSRS